MTFPHINTKATNIEITPKLQELLEQKLSPLGKLLDNQGDTRCEVELEKTAEHHSGKIFRAEINLFNGGKLFRVESTEEQIEQAIDSVKNELRRELQRAQGKRQSLFKRGSQAVKRMLRFGGSE
ncbi:MAG: ribosome-associated translation inhibitor RaiA [Candidatus Pacebacteria bacterium]|nr:ribosome-associated translation inhibitor RaiA [Candidatus Paceibacterota bacterium]MCF7857169.1 ribosome-associated translation inhibitor RaiA [Candidatus Paceibacterota bacterium]